MAIQVRRGLMADFDPYKMLPGEWAVSIDASTSNQIVWMCFSPGICKRMGTYEDFIPVISEIANEYKEELNSMLLEVRELSQNVSKDKSEVLIIKNDVLNVYLPQILNATEETSENRNIAKQEAEKSKKEADRAEQILSQINEAVDINVASFTLNLETGHMEYTGGRFAFMLNTDTGHLEWEVAV